jgi:hypothetical protein
MGPFRFCTTRHAKPAMHMTKLSAKCAIIALTKAQKSLKTDFRSGVFREQ